ncbi:type II secretion system protein GspN [Geomonas sp. Red69]|uniref:Type II secretion system protein GspN n=1 Tax=Geomonas diazotrophica TaxID=2843197 RepID=A0ABX8JLL8_9BACT|nr:MULTISPECIES: type II secretion system protein GspN [Geomonas]MBU5635722.1 type II secretion system protein GspN [Geomonas diazotrophica]QWV98041.1 type II secretion system protein GspN [Geomonas nitrogeniifigens]QXE87172.1 type II secretion system protein GspN [Geomonas nitrogeniifigens]
MKKRTLYLACGVPATLFLFLLLTLLFTPNHAIKGVLVRAAENAGYTLECTGFGKSFPLGLKADKVELGSEKGAILKLGQVKVRLELLPLLTGKARLAYRCSIGAGEAAGELDLGRSKGWSIQCRGVRLEDIPFFSTVAEAKVRGELKLNGKMEANKGGGSGDLQLEVRAAEVAGVKIGSMPLPDASYREVRGALKIDKGRAVLKSFTLNGDGIYVRLSGDTVLGNPVGASPLNLTMEMMPKPSFLERQKFVFLLLTKYQSSPGAFKVPIGGTLAHPSL